MEMLATLKSAQYIEMQQISFSFARWINLLNWKKISGTLICNFNCFPRHDEKWRKKIQKFANGSAFEMAQAVVTIWHLLKYVC